MSQGDAGARKNISVHLADRVPGPGSPSGALPAKNLMQAGSGAKDICALQFKATGLTQCAAAVQQALLLKAVTFTPAEPAADGC